MGFEIGTEISETAEQPKPERVEEEIELPDDSGDEVYDFELPDDSGDELEDNHPLSEIQDAVIAKVESGELQLGTSQEKGNYGEMKCDQTFRELGYKKISTDCVTSLDAKIHDGIDGVYYKFDGKPPYAIVDAKYNKAELNPKTEDGKQMSETWIIARLDKAVGKEMADNIKMAMMDGEVGCYVCKVALKGDLQTVPVFNKLDSNANEVEKDVKLDAA